MIFKINMLNITKVGFSEFHADIMNEPNVKNADTTVGAIYFLEFAGMRQRI